MPSVAADPATPPANPGPVTRWVMLAMVAVAAATLWANRALPAVQPGFDFAALAALVEEAFPGADLLPIPLEPHPELPEQQVLLVGPGPDAPILSLYLGYYPSIGGERQNPHSPRVCYPSEGWDLATAVDRRPVPLPQNGEAIVQQVRVVSGDKAMRTLFWTQEPDAPSTLAERRIDVILRRLTTRRSDAVWTRLELQDPGAGQPLDDALLARVGRFIAGVDRCFR